MAGWRFSAAYTDAINRQGDKLPAATFEADLQRDLGVESVCLLSEQGMG